MITITLPDGSRRQFSAATTVAQVAASIGPGLAKSALAGKVDGKLVDTSFTIESDATLSIITDRDADGLEVLRHSTAHLLAYAVKELFPDAQVTIGPVIENGFITTSPTNAHLRPKTWQRSKPKCRSWPKRTSQLCVKSGAAMRRCSFSNRSANTTRPKSLPPFRRASRLACIARGGLSISVAGRMCLPPVSSRCSS